MEIFNILYQDPQKLLAIVAASTAYAIFIWFFIRRRDIFLRSIRRLVRSIFYSESYDDSDDKIADRMLYLEQALRKVQADLEAKLIKENKQVLDQSQVHGVRSLILTY